MEPEGVKHRGRKRKRRNGEDGGKAGKKPVVGNGTGTLVLIGRYVKKEFEGSGEFLGKIVSYDTGLYRVEYEDGDCEDLETREVKGLLVKDSEMDAAFRKRKKSLDAYLVKKSKSEPVNKVETVVSDNGGEVANADKVESSVVEQSADVDGESSDLSDDEQPVDVVAEAEHPLVPPPQLPPSSGNFGVPEEDVSYLLSVYSFLRSFSVCLFLSPFGLDEFVGALNCSVHNTLLDAIHVALIRALKSHVEILASEGSELALKCQRNMDWSLLDSLTWPVFVVQYLVTMRYAEGQEWKDFYVTVFEKDYFALSAGRKLTILQLLCDDASNSAELMAEIDNREEAEFGPDPDGVAVNDENRPRRGRLDDVVVHVENIPRRGRPRKNPLPNDQEAVKDVPEAVKDVPKTTGSSNTGDDDGGDDDGNGDECRLCGMEGLLICCDGCPSSYHSRCINVMKSFIPEGEWYCPECTINKTGPVVTKKTSLKGAEFFGIDPYEQVFLGSCDHLLVMKASSSSGSHIRYYSAADIQKVVHALSCSVEYTSLYLEICKGILQYWEIPESIFCLPDSLDAINAGNINGVAENDSKDESAAHVSENGNCYNKSNMNSTCDLTNLPSQKKETKFYMGLSFKPQAYLNAYIHGDFSASAGASLAILSSEEKLATQTQSSISNHRKLMSANYSLQTKAFSLAAKRFYWPNYERKLVEVPRERCGWCLSCKATVVSKRGCLLNAAVSNAIKGAAKILSSLRHSKNVEGSLASIATYVMFMEESLYGLTVGPFLNSSYRTQWQKHVEEAVTLNEIKAYLLDFERNIRDIAFTSDWIRHVDDTASESQLSQSAKSVVGSAKKRGGRPGRKPAIVVPEVPDADANDLSSDFAWWRGGMLSKHIFQKGILPQMMIKHAARQGGREKINGVQYVDGLEVPKRSRQFIWRAAVDMSQTASELALQIRYLDLHVRWNELVCPDQPLQDSKGPEAEASAFRNACVIDKKLMGNKLSYGVVFENQKHLPSRVLKKVLEVEETGDKKSKNWFLETHIPLYLIKEYEMVVAADAKLPISDIKHVTKLSKLTKRQLKASGKNIFSFLEQKRDNTGKCCCTFCQRDVSFRVAARCSVCQGYCHEQCAVGTNIQTAALVAFIITCRRCHIEKDATPKNEIVGDSPTSPLLLQGQESQHSTSLIKVGKQNGHERPLSYPNPTPNQPKKGTSGKKSSKNRLLQSVDQKSKLFSSSKGSRPKNSKASKFCLGLIWKKRNHYDTGHVFRINNILLKGNPNGHLLAPKCNLCTQPYNPELMYIRCEKCECWFHADSVDLHESQIMELYGYKCCRCRRIRIPICPYTDPETRAKLEQKKEAMAKSQKQQKSLESDSDFDFDSETNDDLLDDDWDVDSNPVFDQEDATDVQEDNENPYYSYTAVDQFNDDQVNGPKKLPVRRHIKPEKEFDPGFENPDTYAGPNNPEADSSTPIVEWDVSTNGVADNMMFDYGDLNYEDMEFEPQTYFSFNELLASDDGVPPGGPEDPPANVAGPATDDCNPDQFQMGITYDQQEPMFSIETGLEMVPCKVCSQTDPCPDLFCQTCGLWLHQECSPWEEDSSWEPETGWKCGNCREWC